MNTRNVEELEKIIEDNQILSKYGISKIGVFGSFIRDGISNDIDLLIEDEIFNYENLLALRTELEFKMKKKIDIVIQKYANPIVLYRAKKEMYYVTRYKK
jgi:uncharacterized protein